MSWFRYLEFTTGWFLPSLFPTKKILLKNSSASCYFCCMAPFFNIFPISTCIKVACSWPICGVWRILSCVRFFRKGFLNPFTISKISGSFVSISQSHASKKWFNLPASDKFGTIFAESKLFTQGWTFLRSSIGIIGGKNMLKVSFMFIFTLESTLLPVVGR